MENQSSDSVDNVQTGLVQQKINPENQLNSGPGWFFRTAVLSFVNALISFFQRYYELCDWVGGNPGCGWHYARHHRRGRHRQGHPFAWIGFTINLVIAGVILA